MFNVSFSTVKDDLLEGFGSLRKDLKENGELKEVIAKVIKIA